MIRRRVPLVRNRKPIARRSRPNPVRRSRRASLARQCAALWSAAVLRKFGGECWLWSRSCSGPIDAAHVFSKKACPAVRYDPDFGLPTCRSHHRLYGNGPEWQALVRARWGDELFNVRYRHAHLTRTKPDLEAVRRKLRAA